jgi:DNA-binding transcriptional LysR family regulator
MELSQLKLFTEIAAKGSLTKASIALDIEQSVISRQLGALETDLGVRLFHRTGRGMTVTEAGANLLPKAKALLVHAEQVVEDIRAQAGIIRGDVRLGILPAFSYPVITQLHHRMRAACPEVHLQLFEGSNGQLTEWVGTGRVDIAVLYRYDPVDGSETRILGLSEASLISRADDPATQDAEIPFARLRGLPLILPSMPNSLRIKLGDLAKERAFDLKVVMEADSLPIQKNMVADGEGYAILGSHAIIRERAAGELRSSRIVDPTMLRTAVMAISGQRPFSRAMRTVADLLAPLVAEVLGLST